MASKLDCQRKDHGYIKHGLSKHWLYNRWGAMVARCHKPSDKSYPNYGGRGIIVCDEWRSSFKSFYDYMRELPNYERERSLDRIDNDGNYEPGNMRWANQLEQHLNRRPNARLYKSGYKGIVWVAPSWYVKVYVDGEPIIVLRTKNKEIAWVILKWYAEKHGLYHYIPGPFKG